MDNCWLKGSDGNAVCALQCKAGFNIRWLLWATALQTTMAASLVFSLVVLCTEIAMLVVARALTMPTAGSAIGRDA
jgi:IS5 family transposase